MMAPWIKSTTALAILAVVCLAAQHPLSKPLASLSAHGFLVARLGLLLAVLGVPVLFLLANRGRDCAALLRDRHAWLRLLALAGLSVGSLYLYVIGLKETHPIVVALFVNTSVLWAALWTRVFSKRPMPQAFASTVVCALIVILFASWNSGNKGFDEFALEPKSLLLLVVPGLYTLKSVLATRWFHERHPIEVSATLAIVSVILVIPTLFHGSFGEEIQALWAGSTAWHWGSFAAGTTLGTVMGGALYFAALHRSEGRDAYVTAFNLLIPSLAAAIGYGISLFRPGANLSPDWMLGLSIALLLVVLARFTRANRPAKASGLRPGEPAPR
jgi:drug/metabolite transporter (DMT)-like permease